MRTVVVVIMAPQGQFAASIGQGRGNFLVQALLAHLPLKLSISRFSTGLPVQMKSRCTPFLCAHKSIALLAKSVPLSTVIH